MIKCESDSATMGGVKCPVCSKPILTLQKFMKCDMCVNKFHSGCVSRREVKSNTCDACATENAFSRMASPSREQGNDKTIISPNSSFILPDLNKSGSMHAQLQSIQLTSSSNQQLILDMSNLILKLSDEIAELKFVNEDIIEKLKFLLDSNVKECANAAKASAAEILAPRIQRVAMKSAGTTTQESPRIIDSEVGQQHQLQRTDMDRSPFKSNNSTSVIIEKQTAGCQSEPAVNVAVSQADSSNTDVTSYAGAVTAALHGPTTRSKAKVVVANGMGSATPRIANTSTVSAPMSSGVTLTTFPVLSQMEQDVPAQQKATVSASSSGPLNNDLNADNDGFVLVSNKKSKNKINPSPKKITGKKARIPNFGVKNTSSLAVIEKRPKRAALFVSRLLPSTGEQDIIKSISDQISINPFKCSKLKTKFSSYTSFHVSVEEQDFDAVSNTELWPEGCLIMPFYGRLLPNQVAST